ncbi:MAG: stage IV sporulation protein A [Lachnospiraceae bacterium]|nr:stage IV sporulation protein A [Lachnospiraceae bacterium]
MDNFNTYDIYKDMKERTKGELYIGVIGPVRTGKSTFIKRFMELMLIPNMADEHSKNRAKDEMPLAASGKMVTTTEPKFIPKDEAKVRFGEDIEMNVRLIDCVGYMVKGATAGSEENEERMVKTPWFDYEIPFSQAAEIGTQKVIKEHSGLGIVVITDGSFGELPRESYIEAEERTIQELKQIGKPFLVLLNSEKPYKEETLKLAEELESKYQVTVFPVNCQQLRREDINRILEQMLYEFPVVKMEFYMPKWVEVLDMEHPVKEALIQYARALMQEITSMKHVKKEKIDSDSEYLKRVKIDRINLADGCVQFQIDIDEKYYYEMISDMVQMPIEGEYQMLAILKQLSSMRKEYEKVLEAMESVRMKGYGVVTPNQDEIRLEDPVVIKHGSKYGVKIKAESPSIHLIKADIQTEIAPIVGSEQQANDLITYIKENSSSEEGIWHTNIFGKSIEQLVEDGIRNKIALMGEESQLKLQDTMNKIVNDSNGGLVCIII